MDDAKAFGVAIDEPEEPVAFEVWPENWEAVQMFLRVQTQWRTSMGGLLGLDYGAVSWLFRLYAIQDERSTLEALQVMEAAALATINERSG